MSFADFRDEINEPHPGAVFWAILWTAVNFAVLCGYDYLSLMQAGVKLPLKIIIRTASTAFSLSNFVGHAIFSGGSVRLQEYNKEGVPIHKIAQVAIQNSISFWTGFLLLSGLCWTLYPPHATVPDSFHPSWTQAGILCAAFAVAYIIIGRIYKDRVLVIWRFEFIPPTTSITLGQFLVSISDLVLCAAVFYSILPAEAAIGFPEFLSIFLAAQAIGIVSQVPGGLGVFDGVLLTMLTPYCDPHKLLFTILLFRVIYYLLPFCLTAIWFFARSFAAMRASAAKKITQSQKTLQFIVPQFLSIGIIIAGAILLLSTFTPAAAGRLAELNEWLPLPIIELAHLSASITGISLLLLAREITRRSHRSFKLVLALLVVGAFSALLKGFDWEESLVLFIVAGLLAPFEKFFYRRRPKHRAMAFTVYDFEIIGLTLLITIAGFFAYEDIPNLNDTWFKFHLMGEAERFMRGASVTIVMIILFLIIRYLRARPTEIPGQFKNDFSDMKDLLKTIEDSESQLVLVGDKCVLMDATKEAFLMYGVIGSTWVVLGEVYGDDEKARQLTLDFMDTADREGCRVVFYQVREKFVSVLIDLGFRIVKLGDEALIPLTDFNLEGNSRKDLRQAMRRGEKENLVFKVLSPEETTARLPELRAISDAWLKAKNAAEKRFSVGRFEEGYISRLPCAIIMFQGKVVGFANLWLGGASELSVDLMRYDPATAPKSTMDFLFVSLLQWGRDEGFKSFNLGMAPLSGLEVHAWSSGWYKLANLAFKYGERFYNFRGLREYKEKYNPVWKPRYLAVEPGMSIMHATSDVALLVGGGARGFLGL